MIFCAILNIEVDDSGKAAAIAVYELNNALHQARYEFETSSFSLDNHIMIYDETAQVFIPFTKRQALQNSYGRKGSPEHLEKFLLKLDIVKNRHHNSKVIVDKVSKFALQWHRNAMDSKSPEVRFMNHWIALEQLFKNLDSRENKVNASADILVRGVAGALDSDQQERLLTNLWGDLLRCDFMEKKPLISHHAGEVVFSRSFTEKINPKSKIVESETSSRNSDNTIDIRIMSPANNVQKNYRIEHGFRVFVSDGQRIKIGEWLAGLPLTNIEGASKIYHYLFEGLEPPINNLVYLWRHHWSFIKKHIFPYIGDTHLDDLIEASKGLDADLLDSYKKIETLVTDLPDEEFPDSLTGHVENKVEYVINNWIKQDSTVHDTSEKTMWFPNLHSLQGKQNKLIKFLPAYRTISHSFGILLKECGYKNLPPALVRELYRDCELPLERLYSIFQNESEKQGLLLASCPDQPLLKSRIYQVGDPKKDYQFEKYIWDLDRMRRVRNSLVHTASFDNYIDLLSRRLYQYSKIYLSKILNRLAFTNYNNDNELLLSW